jgi:hypothetical protein
MPYLVQTVPEVLKLTHIFALFPKTHNSPCFSLYSKSLKHSKPPYTYITYNSISKRPFLTNKEDPTQKETRFSFADLSVFCLAVVLFRFFGAKCRFHKSEGLVCDDRHPCLNSTRFKFVGISGVGVFWGFLRIFEEILGNFGKF